MADYNPLGRTRIEREGIPGIKKSDAKPYAPSNTPRSTSKFEDSVGEVFDELEALLLSKHHDYGPKNISLSPGGPMNGLRVRLWDKLARLNNLVDKKQEPKYESLEDTLKDMANYAIIGLLVMRDKWDK